MPTPSTAQPSPDGPLASPTTSHPAAEDSQHDDRSITDTARTAVQKGALAVGVVFLLVGILGFVPGVTTQVGSIAFAGHTSPARLLGLFQVSVLHNAVHLVFGVVGLVAARTRTGARRYFLLGGFVYLVLFVYGLIVSNTAMDSMANFVPVNGADNWLHLGLGLGMILLGAVLSRTGHPRATTA